MRWANVDGLVDGSRPRSWRVSSKELSSPTWDDMEGADDEVDEDAVVWAAMLFEVKD